MNVYLHYYNKVEVGIGNRILEKISGSMKRLSDFYKWLVETVNSKLKNIR